MERKDAIEIIKKSWPDSKFTMLREALETLIPELKESEDEKVIRDIKVVLESSATKFFKEEGKMPIWYDRAIAWLEKKGEQKPQGKTALEAINEEKVDNANKVEQNPAWSEEDKKMIDAALQAAHEYGLHGLWFWLKCLKERVLPQNTWKPSDEQIKALEFVIKSLDNMFTAIGLMDNYTKPRLEEILEALKKLREE